MNNIAPNQTPLPAADALQLQDIHLPGAAEFWPPAPGWWLLLALLLGVSIFIVFRVKRYVKKQRYQSYVLGQFSFIEERLNSNDPDALAEINVLLRRLALMHFPRDQVASLTGKKWLQFLDQSGNTQGFSSGVGQVLADASYQKSMPENLDKQQLAKLLKHWVKQISRRQIQ